MIELTVGLTAEREGLAVTLRQEQTVVVTLMEQVVHREIGEFECHPSYQSGLAPTHGEFNLVISLTLKLPVYINRSVGGIRLDIGIDGSLLKMSHVGHGAV